MSVNDLNNAAIALFQRGHHHDAVSCLREAIDQLVGSIRNQPLNRMNPASTAANHAEVDLDEASGLTRPHPCDAPTKISFMSPVVIENHSMIEDNHAASTMYNSAILLPSSPSTQDFTSAESYVDQTSVVLLYNLALINHWRAVHLGISNGLPKALKLYEMALEIIHENRSTNVESLLCAIWNNMGHIYIQLFQVAEARACYSSLWLLLQHREDIRQQLPQGDFNNFLLSAISQAEQLHLAPAA